MNSRGSAPKAGTFKVLVAIDFATTGEGALRRALALANGQRSELHLVTVVDPSIMPHHAHVPSDALALLRELAEGELAAFSAAREAIAIERVVTHLLHGSPAREIVWLAAHLDADLIVVGTHERSGVQRLVLGSVAEKVLHTAGRPVVIDRPKHHDRRGDVPEIEPPCPACVARRGQTAGAEMWCRHHAAHELPRTHVYSWADHSSGGFRPWGFSAS